MPRRAAPSRPGRHASRLGAVGHAHRFWFRPRQKQPTCSPSMAKKPAISKKSAARPRPDAAPEPPGLAARRFAADILDGVLRRHRPLDELLDAAAHPGLAALAD